MRKPSNLMPCSPPEVMEMKSPTEESRRAAKAGSGSPGAKPGAGTNPPSRTTESERSSCEPGHPADRYRFAVVFDDRRKTLVPTPRRD